MTATVDATFVLTYEGATYFFCTLACAGDFARHPERFARRA